MSNQFSMTVLRLVPPKYNPTLSFKIEASSSGCYSYHMLSCIYYAHDTAKKLFAGLLIFEIYANDLSSCSRLQTCI